MEITPNLGLVYGVMLGDGCISKYKKHSFISISLDIHSDQDFVTYFIPILEKIRGKKIKPYYREKYGKIEINFSDKQLFETFCSLEFPIGKKGTNLAIPFRLHNVINQVIQGYFATDGCFVLTNNNGTLYPRLEFSGISLVLLEQVQSYLISVDVVGKIYTSKKYKNGWNTLYRLQINGKKNMHQFQNEIGFANPKHQKKYERMAMGRNSDLNSSIQVI